jgi:hypothetical protein
MLPSGEWRSGLVGVLVSGGPNSVVLLDDLAAASLRVSALYVRCGTLRDDAERSARRSICP